MANANIRFGRSIKPLVVTDVQQNKIQLLYVRLSESARSANITVGAEPVVIKVFGLKTGEAVDILNVFGGVSEQLYYAGQAIRATNTNNTIVLALAGVYALYTSAVLGDIVAIAYPLSALDEKAKHTVALTNPNGPQHHRPNVFLDGVAESKPFFVGSTPLVFRAYGVVTQTITLYNVFDGHEEPVYENGAVASVDAINSTMLITIAGQYKFKAAGDPAGIVLIANPSLANYTEPFMYKGDKGDKGDPGSGGGGSGSVGPQGPPGKDGQIRFTGHGIPNIVVGSSPGDTYMDLNTGDVYKLI